MWFYGFDFLVEVVRVECDVWIVLLRDKVFFVYCEDDWMSFDLCFVKIWFFD